MSAVERLRAYESLFVNTYKDGVKVGMFRPQDPHPIIMGMFGMVNWLY
ncbi:hypothetical protein [Virgibacillus necropolis]